MNVSKPKVSVAIITYNQQAFIAEALESALMQEADFEFEIVVGDDGSDDNTPSILRAIAQKYPTKIRLFLHEQNLGLKGRRNFASTIKACRGQYIALLDGDDYWTVSNKLQQQVGFLDSNTDCAICTHVLRRVDVDGTPSLVQLKGVEKSINTIEDLVWGNFIAASSAMFRAGLFEEFPEWFFENTCGDWILHILNAQHGKIGNIDKPMGVYRNHPDGVSSIGGGVEMMRWELQTRHSLDTFLEPELREINKKCFGRIYLDLTEALLQQKNTVEALKFLIKSAASVSYSYDVSYSEVAKYFCRLILGVLPTRRASTHCLKANLFRSNQQL